MAEFSPFDLIKSMKPESLRVHSPSLVVFLCGGVVDQSKLNAPTYLRDVFWRNVSLTAPKFKVVLAEDAEPLTTDAGYGDLFSFESDIAQIVGLILLFAESPGSLAELGAFAALGTVAPRLLAVLDDFYYSQVSFIRNGPIKFLENRYGEEWVLVLERSYVGIGTDGKISGLDDRAFMASILPEIDRRLNSLATWSRLNINNSGHVILLLTGLCQEFGALTVGELKNSLELFGAPTDRLINFLYCAMLLGWIRKVRKGHHIYYVAVEHEHAIDYQLGTSPSARDKQRWRADIRDYYRLKDGPRTRAIAEVVSPTVSAK